MRTRITRPLSCLSVPICPSVTFSEKPMKFVRPPPLRVSAAAPERGAIRNNGNASAKISNSNATATNGSRALRVAPRAFAAFAKHARIGRHQQTRFSV